MFFLSLIVSFFFSLSLINVANLTSLHFSRFLCHSSSLSVFFFYLYYCFFCVVSPVCLLFSILVFCFLFFSNFLRLFCTERRFCSSLSSLLLQFRFLSFFYNFTTLANYHFSSSVMSFTSPLTISSPLFHFSIFFHFIQSPHLLETHLHTHFHTPVIAPIQSAPVSRFLVCISLQGESRLRHTSGRTG